MTKLRRFSLTAYQAPLCETIVDCPEPQGSEVLVRVERCGACHSDLHIQDGYFALAAACRSRLVMRSPAWSSASGRRRAWLTSARALLSIHGSVAAPAPPAAP